MSSLRFLYRYSTACSSFLLSPSTSSSFSSSSSSFFAFGQYSSQYESPSLIAPSQRRERRGKRRKNNSLQLQDKDYMNTMITSRNFSSIKDDELKKFSSYGKNWWTTKKSSSCNDSAYLCMNSVNGEDGGGAGPLHDLNPVRVKYFVDQYNQHKIKRNYELNTNNPNANSHSNSLENITSSYTETEKETIYQDKISLTGKRKIQKSKQEKEEQDKKGMLVFEGLKVLDVGCGGGLLSESLARLGAHVTAIDPSEANIFVAKEHAKLDPMTRRINYQQTTIEEVATEVNAKTDVNIETETDGAREDKDQDNEKEKEEKENERANWRGKYDIVFASEVIEHVANVPTFVENLKRVIKPNGEGHLFITTINRTMKSYLLAIVAAEKILGIVPNDTHHWNDFCTPEEVIAMLKQGQRQKQTKEKNKSDDNHDNNNYNTSNINSNKKGKDMVDVDIVNISGLIYNPLNNTWFLDPHDLDINYFVHARSKVVKENKNKL